MRDTNQRDSHYLLGFSTKGENKVSIRIMTKIKNRGSLVIMKR